MKKEEFQRIKDVFFEVSEAAPDERETILRQSCGDDHALMDEVRSLLKELGSDEELLEKNALAWSGAEVKDYKGQRFGNYTIEREIGAGGMGKVFLAKRVDGEFDQQVAIKIVRQTIGSSDLERHFRRERQILASLSHPNIAHLLDGGVSENGEPYFVMEYIDGVPLDRFTAEMSLDEKLRVFLQICAAVAFAHRNLIVHSDLKPSNILVDKDGQVKLLDFGLARIENLEWNAGDVTQPKLTALTPAYASPEQMRGETVTTATDVYSLGVVLYELLCGEKPFHFENKKLDEILKTITDSDPPPPSAPLDSKMPDRRLRGDLDNIVLMSLRKEPARRYPSAEAFANDIQRYLDHRPVSARPGTFKYRTSKFIRRNKIALVATALIVLAIVVGASVAAVQYRRAEQERARALEVNEFLKTMLLTANPHGTSAQKTGYSASINDMLEQAAKRLDGGGLDAQPDVKAELAATIGTTYLNQGQYDLAEKYLSLAETTTKGLYGPASLQLAIIDIGLANLAMARSRYDAAEELYNPNLSILRTAFAEHKYSAVEFSSMLNNLALLKRARGDSREAELLYRESLSVAETDPDNSQSKYTETFIALTLFDQGKFDEAESDVRRLADSSRQTAGDSVELANELTLLGSILSEKGNFDDAARSLKEAEAIYRKLTSPTNIAIFDDLRLQAQVSYLAGRYSDADQKIDDVLANYRQNATPQYVSFASALIVKGSTLNKLGRTDDAERQLREALRLREANLPSAHYMTALSRGALGEFLISKRSFDEAEALLLRAAQDLQTSQAPGSTRLITARHRLAALYDAWSRPDLAEQYR